MATSKDQGEGDAGGDLANRFECITIAPGKMKYMNPNFSKISAKVGYIFSLYAKVAS
jgi:hypothetical protein